MTLENQEIIRTFLDEQYALHHQKFFIEKDPISIPHQYTKLQDIEISGFFAAILAWGQRKTIIKKCQELMQMMDNAPYQFIVGHKESDLKPFLSFKHRTFNAEDTLYCIHFLKFWYGQNTSLETAFSQFLKNEDKNIQNALIGFRHLFFSLPEAPRRTEKHIATPAKNSACKRLCMYLRWLVRKDTGKVKIDFGLWEKIKPWQLVCPCDVHTERTARLLGLVKEKQTNWRMAVELTENLKKFDAQDPTKYDFALFGSSEKNLLGVYLPKIKKAAQ
ncbi:MAG: TIGR02757 family protein [Raineya sp.]